MSDTKPVVHVDRSYLKALLRIAPKFDIRYYLCGVYIEATPTHTTMVATDGHRLLILRKQAENTVKKPINFILAREILENVIRFNRKKAADIELQQESENKWSALLYDMNCSVIQFGVIEAKYPDFSHVIPDKVSGEAGCYNADYLSDFKKIAKDISCGESSLLQNGEDSCAVVTFGINTDCIGAVMPMRFMNMASSWRKPAWFPAPKAKKPVAKKKVEVSKEPVGEAVTA